MAQPSFDLATAHRWFAVECNNAAWSLLEAPVRSAEEAERMVHLAHAACHHWLQVGTPLHHARALLLVANVSAEMGWPQPALHFSQRVLDLLRTCDDAADWDLAFAEDARSRALAVAGDPQAASVREAARAAGERIAKTEDKAMFEQWFLHELPPACRL